MAIDENKMDSTMMDLGFTQITSGTKYLRRMISLYESEPGLPFGTGYIATVAKEREKTCAAVERAARHAIEVAWQRGDMTAERRVFGHSVDPERGMPTIREFVMNMAGYCRAD